MLWLERSGGSHGDFDCSPSTYHPLVNHLPLYHSQINLQMIDFQIDQTGQDSGFYCCSKAVLKYIAVHSAFFADLL